MTTKNYLWKDNPTQANVAVYDPDVLNECLMHLKYSSPRFTRFCVNSASVDTSGTPNLLNYSGNTVSFNCGISLVPTMASNSTTPWTLSASHTINTSATDIYKSFDSDSTTYCSLAHTPTADSPSSITVTQSAAFTFDYLYLKFNSIYNSGDMKNFSIKDASGTVLYSYDNAGAFLDKDEFLIPIYNFNSTQFVISTISNVNGASYVNFPSTIKLLDKTQVIAMTNAQGSSAFLIKVASFTLSTNGTYIVYLGTDGTVETFATTLTVGKVLPTSPVANQVHYLTCSEIPQAKKYNGSVWVAYDKVPVGKVVVANSAITSVLTNSYAQNGYDINANSSSEVFYSTPTQLVNGTMPTSWTAYNTGLTNSVVYLQIRIYPTNNGALYQSLQAYTDVITSAFVTGVYCWTGYIYENVAYFEIPTKNGIINFYATAGSNTTDIRILGYRKMTGV